MSKLFGCLEREKLLTRAFVVVGRTLHTNETLRTNTASTSDAKSRMDIHSARIIWRRQLSHAS